MAVGRRSAAVVRRAPVPIAAAALVLVAVPFVLARSVSAALATSGDALADPDAARLIVASLLVPALAGGAALSQLIATPRALGQQLATAPVSARALRIAAAAPTAVGAVPFAPVLAALVVPFGLAAPGGGAATATLVGAVLASWAIGMVAPRLVASARRGAPLAGLALVGFVSSVGGLVLADSSFEPTRAVARVLAGTTPGRWLVLGSAAITGIALATWSSLDCGPRRHGSRTRGRSTHAIFRWFPMVALALLGLARRRDTRGAILAGGTFGLVSEAAGSVLGLGPAAASLFGLSSALAATVLAPLALGGLLHDARWLLGSSPGNALRRAGGATGGAVLATALAVVPLVLVLLGQGQLTPHAATVIGLGVALAAGCGSLAGLLAPWRAGSAAEQTAALSVLAALAAGSGGLAVGGGMLADRLSLPEPPIEVVIGLAPLVGSVLLGFRFVGAR